MSAKKTKGTSSKVLDPGPEPFLEVLVHKLDSEPGLSALCAGYEAGKWRAQQLSKHLMEWLPEFALSHTERKSMRDYNSVALIRKAAKAVYTTEKYHKRGEFGELLLHVVIRQVFGSLPAISKIYYKDSTNHTVLGLDAVHVVVTKKSLELWLGEVKFYDDIGRAIRDVVHELDDHTKHDYLRDEFTLISNKIDPQWPHSRRLKRLIHPNTSLDTIFDAACIPVLLTYDSATVQSYDKYSKQYKQAFEAEVLKHHADFCSRNLPQSIRVHLFLLPLHQKQALLHELHESLKAWQKI